ncbi:hypothetical protein [Azospirillum argentinense]
MVWFPSGVWGVGVWGICLPVPSASGPGLSDDQTLRPAAHPRCGLRHTRTRFAFSAAGLTFIKTPSVKAVFPCGP